MNDGYYSMDYTFRDVRYTRKVLVEQGYYRFVDDLGQPLPMSQRLSVDVAKTSDAQAVFTAIDLSNDGPAGNTADVPPEQPMTPFEGKRLNRVRNANSRLERVVAAAFARSTEGLCHG